MGEEFKFWFSLPVTWKMLLNPLSHIPAPPCLASESSTSTPPPIYPTSLSCAEKFTWLFKVITFPWWIQMRVWGCTRRHTSPQLPSPPPPPRLLPSSCCHHSPANYPSTSRPQICWMEMATRLSIEMTMATDLTLVLSWSTQTVERRKSAAMIAATLTQEPGNTEDVIRVEIGWNKNTQKWQCDAFQRAFN